MKQFDYSQLDPGIRLVVQWLHENGFETSDSGDGSKAGWQEHALPFPHVYIKTFSHDLVREANRLFQRLAGISIKVQPQSLEDQGVSIQAMYCPADDTAAILLMNLNSAQLKAALAGELV